jgi:MraZ protein
MNSLSPHRKTLRFDSSLAIELIKKPSCDVYKNILIILSFYENYPQKYAKGIKNNEIRKLVGESGEKWGILCNFEGKSHHKDVRMRFLGNIEAKIDSKGRAFLPAQFRKALMAPGEDELVLRQDIFENTLVIYPQSVWNALIDEMRGRLSRWDRRQQMVYRTFVSGVTSITIDSSGRILIPKSFLQAAGITQSLRFVGMGDTIEIWANDPDVELPLLDKDEFGKALEKLMKPRPSSPETEE